MPALPAVGSAENRRVFHASINRVRICDRRLQVPHSLELPGMLRPVIPLMRSHRLTRFRRRIVRKLVALALWPPARVPGRFARGRSRLVPGFATVVGALNDLSKPAA